MRYIGDNSKRPVTREKRLFGLVKKAIELSILTGDEILVVHKSECKGRKKMRIYSSKDKVLPEQHLLDSLMDLADQELPKEFIRTAEYQRKFVHGKPIYRFTSKSTSTGATSTEAYDGDDTNGVVTCTSQCGVYENVSTNLETEESTHTLTEFWINIRKISESTHKLREHLKSPPPPPPSTPLRICAPEPRRMDSYPYASASEPAMDLTQTEAENLIFREFARDIPGIDEDDDVACCLDDWLANLQSDVAVES